MLVVARSVVVAVSLLRESQAGSGLEAIWPYAG